MSTVTDGFCPALLADLADNFEAVGVDPANKVTPARTLTYLLDKHRGNTMITMVEGKNGHVPTADIRYMTRGTALQVQEAISCGGSYMPGYKQKNVPISKAVQISLYFDRDTIRRYCTEASTKVDANGTPMMKFMRDTIYTQLNGGYQVMSKRLAQDIKSAAPTAQTINIPIAGNTFDMTSGMEQVMGILEDKEMCGTPDALSGSNIFRNLTRYQQKNAITYNQAGLKVVQDNEWNLWYELQLRTLFATEQAIFIDPGSVEILMYDRNVASFAGKLGTSTFAQLIDPRVQCRENNDYSGFKWELQIKEIDCPTTLTNAYTGQSGTFNEGYAVYLSKRYDSWVMPSDAYDGADPLAGYRGLTTINFTNV